MRHWVRDFLEEVVAAGARLDPDQVGDAQRLASIVEGNAYYAFRSDELERLAEAIAQTDSLDRLAKLLWNVAVSAGFKHASLFVLAQRGYAAFRTRVCTSYPRAWLQHYQENNYQFCDPVRAAAMETDRPFEFRETPSGVPLVEEFWRAVEAHGAGQNGYCIPVRLGDGSRIGVSFSTDKPEELASESVRRHRSDLWAIAHGAAEAFGTLARPEQHSCNELTVPELRFLHLLMTHDDPVQALRISDSCGGNRSVQNAIVSKLGVKNILQAVAIASANNWFDELPYFPSDVAFAMQERVDCQFIGSDSEDD